MREIELKSVVPDEQDARRRLVAAGAELVFEGAMLDRRYDTPDRALAGSDEVLRLRVESSSGRRRGQLDFKGPASFPGGYKVREETGTPVDDPEALHAILSALGYVITREIDRDVAVYVYRGATVRFERYPRMDILVEVEGEPGTIEAAIEALAIPRAGFTTDSLAAFVRRYEERTRGRAAIFAGEIAGDFLYRLDDA